MYRVPSVDHLCTNIRCRSNYNPQRSFGQSNIFTGMSQSFCPWGGGLPMMSLPTWVPGPMLLLGRGVSAWSHVPSGESLSRGVSVVETPLQERPHQEWWAVRILLECFLVDFMYTAFSCSLLCFQVHKISSYTNEKDMTRKVLLALSMFLVIHNQRKNCLQHSNT